MRVKYFSPVKSWPTAYELDEQGIPAIAYWNTKGDTPIKAIQHPGVYAYKVIYVPDDWLIVRKNLNNY